MRVHDITGQPAYLEPGNKNLLEIEPVAGDNLTVVTRRYATTALIEISFNRGALSITQVRDECINLVQLQQIRPDLQTWNDLWDLIFQIEFTVQQIKIAHMDAGKRLAQRAPKSALASELVGISQP